MRRADDFVELFNRADAHVRSLAAGDRMRSFSAAVIEAAERSAIVRRRKDLLLSFAELRNAIVHDRGYPRRIIAEPLPEVVDELQRVVEELSKAKKLIPAFQRDVQCFAPEDPLADALRYMRRHDYSQIVVRDGGKLAVLTDEGIGRWLEASLSEEIIDLVDQRVGDALAHQLPGSFEILRAGDTVDDAIEAFTDAPAKGLPRIYAVLVTQRGRGDEQPLGIITAWDLFELVGGR